MVDDSQPTQLTREQIEKCILAIIKYEKSIKIQDSKTSHLFITIGLKKIPEKKRIKPIQIPLTHPYRKDADQVCLITKDPQNDYKNLLKQKRITSIHKVIGIEKLRKKYQPYEARRILCSSYEVFLADRSVISLLPQLLGKEFFQKKKIPIPVKLSSTDLQTELQDAIYSTCMFIPTGPCITIKLGDINDQSLEHLVDNVMDSIPNIIQYIPRKWKNIQSLYLKSTDSLSLPIYQESSCQ